MPRKMQDRLERLGILRYSICVEKKHAHTHTHTLVFPIKEGASGIPKKILHSRDYILRKGRYSSVVGLAFLRTIVTIDLLGLDPRSRWHVSLAHEAPRPQGPLLYLQRLWKTYIVNVNFFLSCLIQASCKCSLIGAIQNPACTTDRSRWRRVMEAIRKKSQEPLEKV